jgi:hypothetical protein
MPRDLEHRSKVNLNPRRAIIHPAVGETAEVLRDNLEGSVRSRDSNADAEAQRATSLKPD